MSITALILAASIPVKLVMLTLVLASLVSWFIIFSRMQVLGSARRALHRFEDQFWSGMDLGQLYREVADDPRRDSGLEHIFSAGFKEFTRLRQQSTSDPDAIMTGAMRAMRVASTRESEKLDAQLSFLATVGSTSPYIGLLGTVYGIMHSFQELAVVKQATISSVAPGIVEALVATAMGLIAAIPAVIAYNRFSTRVDKLITAYETFSDEFSSILHRQVHATRARKSPAS